jgi:hypothetical protein
MAVDKYHSGGKVVIMLNDILEVREGLAAFIHGCVTGRVRIVDDVDVVPPTVVVSISIWFRLLLLLQKGITHSVRSALTQFVSSAANLAITMIRSLGTMMGVES